MTSGGSVLRVAVDVTPRLFSDALTRVLEHHEVQVVTLTRAANANDHLDIVVTSASGRDHLPPDVLVVEVHPGAGPGQTGPAPAVLTNPEAVRDLEDLIAVIQRFAGPPEQVPVAT